MEKHTFIAFLRGVMPSGKNSVPMSRLRQILNDDGFEDVRTWIQSGNVLLRTLLPAPDTARRIHWLIKEHIGAELPVIVKSREELCAILDGNPFKEGYDISRIFFSMYNERPDRERVDNLLAEDVAPEKLAITPDAVYMFIPGTYGRGRLSNNYIEKKLKIAATMRNFNTISKMIEMSG